MKENKDLKIDMSVFEETEKFLKKITEKYNWKFNEKGELVDMNTNKVIMNEKIMKEYKEKEKNNGKHE